MLVRLESRSLAASAAELTPLLLQKRLALPLEIGFAKGTFTVPDEFFEPLPADLLDAFEGFNTRLARVRVPPII